MNDPCSFPPCCFWLCLLLSQTSCAAPRSPEAASLMSQWNATQAVVLSAVYVNTGKDRRPLDSTCLRDHFRVLLNAHTQTTSTTQYSMSCLVFCRLCGTPDCNEGRNEIYFLEYNFDVFTLSFASFIYYYTESWR